MREKGDCSMLGWGGGSSYLIYWPGEGHFLEHKAWALIQGKTEVNHRVRLQDANNPIVAAMTS